MTADRSADASADARLEEVLAEGFADALGELSIVELRRRRELAQQAEDRTSFARRVLQGRIDVLRAEILGRGQGAEAADLLSRLPAVLADGPAAPSDPAKARAMRSLTAALDDTTLTGEVTDLARRSLDELEALGDRYGEQERTLSARRRRLFDVIDALQEEIAERYRRGDASIDELLAGS